VLAPLLGWLRGVYEFFFLHAVRRLPVVCGRGRGCGVVAAVAVVPVTDSFAALRVYSPALATSEGWFLVAVGGWVGGRVGGGSRSRRAESRRALGDEAAHGKRRDASAFFGIIILSRRPGWDSRAGNGRERSPDLKENYLARQEMLCRA
jgi:hypothetical protein